ncbi:hypothetical protein [Niabella ginsenosidivorans]|uniref:hypothetical protein n=1 Tax=Niabella ginsenosidivorans TaxID=1176587 RepID=UPI001C54F6E8|nr:hypothetical protein [Niabella ginsenosidivorans]
MYRKEKQKGIKIIRNGSALARNYRFDKEKIDFNFRPVKITVTNGQLAYEMKHLLKKLETRDPGRFQQLRQLNSIEPVALFKIKEGPVASWEIIKYPD